MKKYLLGLLSFLLLVVHPIFCSAQIESRQKPATHEIQSPENNARRISRELKKMFGLSDSQYNKVYKLYLKQEKALMSSNSVAHNNMGPQGFAMGGPNGSMGGFGNSMGPRSMSGNKPDGAFDRSQQTRDMEKMAKQMRNQREKRHKKLAKKMKKILSSEQFLRWEEWELKRNELKGSKPEGRLGNNRSLKK